MGDDSEFTSASAQQGEYFGSYDAQEYQDHQSEG